jgi:hypothetical protein
MNPKGLLVELHLINREERGQSIILVIYLVTNSSNVGYVG